MVLLIDVGNTNVVFGLTKDGNNFETWRLATQKFGTEDELFVMISNLLLHTGIKMDKVKAVVISSVVPALNYVFQKFVEKYLKVEHHWVEACDGLGVVWNVKNPSEIGADRVANVLAVVDETKDAIVVDVGTAITIDVLKSGCYEGGAILPGLATAAYSLFEKTAKLPQVDLYSPVDILGKDTVENIRIGIVKGTAHAINGLVKDILKIYINPPVVYLTGGQSVILEKFVEHHKLLPDLTLRGMYNYWLKKCASCS
ncbi:type III pantothenate kinase [Pseudothermotoga thermarum]|uniref:Type III pantothenate kinase n=1 Tax=Pseudothermotoga thermarum DSM 5069 TaxID=688269 RepID=F7YXQ5_9THEM|nr:type III pantothenate kinase [Pseudothermotoga thermarum]AEH50699.1 putative transcriptional acitvator, Baf family [Pseudothermotoga thermarum DSM 5069]